MEFRIIHFYTKTTTEIFPINNRQVGMHTKHINVNHNFLRYIVEEKYIDINYIRSKETPRYIMTKNCSEADHIKNTRNITEIETWEVVETGRKNVKYDGITDGVAYWDSLENYSHILINTVDHTNGI